VPAELADQRLDRVVRELFAVPWSRARAWIRRGKIAIGPDVVTAIDVAARAGQQLRYTEDARPPRGERSFDDRCVVHLDTHLIVAAKPAGILTVPYRGEGESFDKQLRSYLARRTAKPRKRRGALPSLMTVHRLDKGTSGLLVFARTWLAKEGLARQLREHSVTRRYVALVHGAPRSCTITSHLLQDRGDGIRGSRERSPNPKLRRSGKGRRAVTHVELIETVNGISRISCRLETGRTNQIRIQLAELGHPLLGERTYMRGYQGPRILAPRLMLHAAELGFVHPATGKLLSFTRRPPADFALPLRRG
jgi:23S rRNA pseudouridine1911/1915/1917 synthase